MKSRLLVAGLITAVGALYMSVGAGGASAAVVSQTFEAQSLPVKQSNKVRGPMRLRVDVDTLYNAPPFTNFTPPAVRTVIDFDKDFAFNPGTLRTCSAASLSGKDTAAAQASCPGAKVGQGNSTVRTQTGVYLFGVVTAFNGVRSGGAPTVLLHVDLGPGVPTKPILTGVLTRSPVAGFGSRLDVTIPPVPGTVITHFDTTINKIVSKVKKKKIRNKKSGKTKTKKIKSFFASARCTDGRWAHQETTTFQDGSSKLDLSTPQVCKAKKAKKKKRK